MQDVREGNDILNNMSEPQGIIMSKNKLNTVKKYNT